MTHIWADGVLRSLGPRPFIGWWDLSEAAAGAAALREAAHFKALGQKVEWRIFSHDRPANLPDALRAAGFIPDPPETFVVFDQAAQPPPDGAASGIEIRRARDEAGLADLLTVDQAAFGRARPKTAEDFRARMQAGTTQIWIAYADGVPVAAGRLEVAEGRPFAGLYGGGALPAWRGRGIYRALVAARAAEARRLGARFLTVDAMETSRPILQRLGFQALATVQGWMSEASP